MGVTLDWTYYRKDDLLEEEIEAINAAPIPIIYSVFGLNYKRCI